MHHLSSKPFLLFILPVLSYFGATLLLAPHITHAAGNTYYVRTGGDDGHSCSQAQTDSDGNAKGSIQAGIDCATNPGDTVIMHGGTYSEMSSGACSANRPCLTSAGTSGALKTLRAAPGETVWLNNYFTAADGGNGEWWVIDGLNVDCQYRQIGQGDDGHGEGIPCLRIDSNTTIQNMEVKNGNYIGILGDANNHLNNVRSHGHGMQGTLCNNGPAGGQCHGFYTHSTPLIVENCELYDNHGWGIATDYDVGPGNAIVRNNKIHGTIGGIMVIQMRTPFRIYNNLLYNGVGMGIWLMQSNGTEIDNNTFYGNPAGIEGRDDLPTTGSLIRNNIFWNSGTPINLPNSSGNTLSNNLLSDPNFVSSSDFHLQSSSPARDAGTTLPDVPCDFDGATRPAGSSYDIGAYEYGGTPGSGCSKGGGGTPTPAPTPQPPIITISAIPSTISVSGQGITLSWSVTNATSCTAQGGWSGTQASAGNTRFTPNATTIYTLVCQGPGGEGQGSATVTVGQSTSCTKYASGSSIPAGFGVPWDVTNPNILLLNATCTSPTVLLKVGNQQASNVLYIYKTAYTAPAGASGWTPVDLFGSSLISGAWYRSFAQGVATMETSTPSYYVGYTCRWIPPASGQAGKWLCGCRDSACSQSYWQIQRIQQ